MQILFGVLLLISCVTIWADDNPCYYIKEREDVYREEGVDDARSFVLKGGEKLFGNDKKWMFCDASNDFTSGKVWSCSNDKTFKDLIENHELLRESVEGGNLCDSTVATQIRVHKEKIEKLKDKLRQLGVENENYKKSTGAKQKNPPCIEDPKTLRDKSQTNATLETANREKRDEIEKVKQQCNHNITHHITNHKKVILKKKKASLHDLKKQLNLTTQMFEEAIKKNNCSVCSAETCYSTPSVKAELDNKYLENSWLNLTAAHREQCLLDDTMLLPMLSYMRRKPFDGAYAYNQNVDMMEKLFALLISFLCFLI
ncbi:hypothetical protein, conserved [Trypanosoma brucei brucei TREU927]|uniref:Uncharacterized protein n=1 Tax=Trypanosoma brucei brucei (strain 927/4 GUTat10.1) TaxID=185431 RepID=Q38EG2_TRYB2|nr:hypothetical protein, conserved [Trypanosoma brucei brucei TREU927]XP_827138.1 hypothetical protein, conserved [Trypanosoma brucei brucei TREU927]EAN76805.1 hypothetical protein, conserved [Trypanosoma brucei brucei TREU927]EAN76808.1 hypothetical protein, conserved [Trypanosoma brucei brucei TREU927]